LFRELAAGHEFAGKWRKPRASGNVAKQAPADPLDPQFCAIKTVGGKNNHGDTATEGLQTVPSPSRR